MSTVTAEQVKAGQAPYNRLFLAIYNPVDRFKHRFLWRCQPSQVLDLYNEHVSANHLDVGLATGMLLDRCRFPVPSPRLALMDLNPST